MCDSSIRCRCGAPAEYFGYYLDGSLGRAWCEQHVARPVPPLGSACIIVCEECGEPARHAVRLRPGVFRYFCRVCWPSVRALLTGVALLLLCSVGSASEPVKSRASILEGRRAAYMAALERRRADFLAARPCYRPAADIRAEKRADDLRWLTERGINRSSR